MGKISYSYKAQRRDALDFSRGAKSPSREILRAERDIVHNASRLKEVYSLSLIIIREELIVWCVV